MLPLEFKDPHVRDLAWVLASPSLLSDAGDLFSDPIFTDQLSLSCYERLLAWLRSVDQNPVDLHQFINQKKPTRLGLYFEALISYWLQHDPEIHLLAEHRQVFAKKQTLGEFDYIVSWNGEVELWEVAVKYYLFTDESNTWQAYVGPNATDRLDIKLNKVFQQQLRLAETPEGQEVATVILRESGGSSARKYKKEPGLSAAADNDEVGQIQKLKPENIKTRALIKGCLFYPIDMTESVNVPGVATDHLRGWWIAWQRQALPYADDMNIQWILLPRLQWLSPLTLSTKHAVLTYQEVNKVLDEHFAQSQQAQLAIALQLKDDEYVEVSRGMVVATTWPSLN